MSEKLDITLEDVECAIRVINEFLKRERDAKRVLRRLGLSIGLREERAGMMGFSFERFVQTAYEEVQRKQREAKAGVEEPISELSDEDLKRMREIAKKRKEDVKTSPTSR